MKTTRQHTKSVRTKGSVVERTIRMTSRRVGFGALAFVGLALMLLAPR